MFQTTKTPVKVYRNTDPDAPQLTNTAGSLKTLLKACLVTGYGAGDNRKEPLGWAMPFEESFKAAFKSQSPKSNQHVLKIDNTNSDYVIFDAFLTIEDGGVGQGKFNTGNSSNGRFYTRAPINNWLLVGHEQAFLLLLSKDNKTSRCLFFGDVPSLNQQDIGNTLFIHTGGASYIDYNLDYYMAFIGFALNNKNLAVGDVNAGIKSLFWNDYFSYPDEFTGGLFCSEVYLMSESKLRCWLPCLMSSAHNLANKMDNFSPVDLGDGQDWIYTNFASSSSSSSSVLVNLSAWEA